MFGIMNKFINRTNELELLNRLNKRHGLVVVAGRRRVGKTRLLSNWLSEVAGIYTQAIEGSAVIQFDQVCSDLLGPNRIETSIRPKTWEELFELISRETKDLVICIDEFPYLVSSDPTLPSRFQRWLDHSKKRNLTLVLAGSSRRLMYDTFLDVNAALYGRAVRVINVEPMSFQEFCAALRLPVNIERSFLTYSLVGGVPKYWELIDPKLDPVEIAEDLYFDFAPYMEGEPRRVLKDEKLDDLYPHSVLETIGRGANRPSEIAARLQSKQQNLSRLLQLLLEANLIKRDLPFGVSSRDAKHVLYSIIDPALRFWYTVYSPHKSRWSSYSRDQKFKLIYDHASFIFEEYCRRQYQGACRYWDKTHEFDMIAPIKEAHAELLVAEIKFRKLDKKQQHSIVSDLENRWKTCKLAKQYKRVNFLAIGLNHQFLRAR
jgi:AAA+ ATPase superfamily predicted ATPase